MSLLRNTLLILYCIKFFSKFITYQQIVPSMNIHLFISNELLQKPNVLNPITIPTYIHLEISTKSSNDILRAFSFFIVFIVIVMYVVLLCFLFLPNKTVGFDIVVIESTNLKENSQDICQYLTKHHVLDDDAARVKWRAMWKQVGRLHTGIACFCVRDEQCPLFVHKNCITFAPCL